MKRWPRSAPEPSSRLRAILDTNVLVSMALAREGRFSSIWQAWRSGRFEVLSCRPLVEEIRDVLERPKLAKLVPAAARERILEDLAFLTISIELQEPFPEFRDPKDRFLLALARDGHADVLVTGDATLLDVIQFADTVIVSPADFMRALRDP